MHPMRPYKKFSSELNVLSVRLKVYFGKCLKKTLVVPQSRAFSPNSATDLSSAGFSFSSLVLLYISTIFTHTQKNQNVLKHVRKICNHSANMINNSVKECICLPLGKDNLK